MQLKNLEDIREFQENSRQEFQENLERYHKWEEQAQEDFNALIYGEDTPNKEEA